MGVPQSLSQIGKVFYKFNTEISFDFDFIDQEYSKKFGEEERI